MPCDDALGVSLRGCGVTAAPPRGLPFFCSGEALEKLKSELSSLYAPGTEPSRDAELAAWCSSSALSTRAGMAKVALPREVAADVVDVVSGVAREDEAESIAHGCLLSALYG